MSRTIMLIPASAGVGLTSVSMGVLRAMERKGVKVLSTNQFHSHVLAVINLI